jgi:hypothetical protein
LFFAGFTIIATLLFGADSKCSRSIRTEVRFLVGVGCLRYGMSCRRRPPTSFCNPETN